MAITNLNKILRERQQQYQKEEEKDENEKVLMLMYKYMEESFSEIKEFLDIVNKNQVILLNKIEELKEKE